jgi:hypothetical protein
MTLLQQIFSDAFVNRAAASNNPLMVVMYRLAYPFSFILNRTGISPDQITTLSLLSAIMAFFVLILHASIIWFILFWGIAVLLDFCDGTVARMSSRISTRAFCYDHMSDIVKISLVIVGVAIHFDDKTLWVLCSTFLFVHLYSEIVSHDLKNLTERWEATNSQLLPADVDSRIVPRVRDRILVVHFLVTRLPLVYRSLLQIYVIMTTFNGHTLLLFLALPLGGVWTYATVTYLIVLAVHSGVRSIRTLWSMRR